MGRNNICVIYDSDENYAKRLMSVINDDNDIPYNAQVFTKEHELDKYLQEKEADMLMICEGAYGYNAYRTGNKTLHRSRTLVSLESILSSFPRQSIPARKR